MAIFIYIFGGYLLLNKLYFSHFRKFYKIFILQINTDALIAICLQILLGFQYALTLAMFFNLLTHLPNMQHYKCNFFGGTCVALNEMDTRWTCSAQSGTNSACWELFSARNHLCLSPLGSGENGACLYPIRSPGSHPNLSETLPPLH